MELLHSHTDSRYHPYWQYYEHTAREVRMNVMYHTRTNDSEAEMRFSAQLGKKQETTLGHGNKCEE